MRRTPALALPVAFALIWFTSVSPSRMAAQDPGPVLVPFLVHDVHVPAPAAAQLLVANRATTGEPIQLLELEVASEDGVLERRVLDSTLTGDPDYVALAALGELLPEELAHRHCHARYFADPDAEELEGEAAREGLARYQSLLRDLTPRYQATARRPFAALNHVLAYDQLFDGSEAPGATAEVTWTVTWSNLAGAVRRSSVSEVVSFRGPRPGLPETLQQGGSLSLHSGDLHVHSCHGEALGACGPGSNCTAESFQVSGSFSYAQLKSQYQVLGMDWFTATDHSYCINDTAEYNAIVAETAAITDGSFVCIPDTELSSNEVGSQTGVDLADALCLGLTPQNHMGAHGISSRFPGGSDGLLGFCSGLEDFTTNVTNIRAQGGYPIVNHPDGLNFGWNSRDTAAGQEFNGLHGVEIWNGESMTGQGGNVSSWVDWLLAGRVLYAYSGSDTHGEAFAFGANHALVEGAFSTASLEAALKAGRVYLSNGPSLVLEGKLGGSILPMGAQVTLPSPVPTGSVEVTAHVDMGAATGSVTLFRGRVGDASETAIGQSSAQTGSFSFSVTDALAGGRTYYRAYVEDSSGDLSAYSNPIFLSEGTGDPITYCVGKENSTGCVPAMSTVGVASASAGSGFSLNADLVRNDQFGILVYAYQAAFIPFDDATLCVGGSLFRTPIQNSGGSSSGADCSGQLQIDFNAWIATGNDPGLVAGTTSFAQYWYRDPAVPSTTGLSDATQFLIYP